MRIRFINSAPDASALGEMKQLEILDSIHYAKRIQRSLLPTERYIARHFSRLKENK